MTKDEIIKLAKEAGLVDWLPNSTFSDGIWWIDAHEPGSELHEFASLVAKHEREKCAKVCLEDGVQAMDFAGGTFVGGYFAAKIIDRGDS